MIWNTIEFMGGTVLHVNGDEMDVFIDQEIHPVLAETVCGITSGLQNTCQNFSDQMNLAAPVRFRAALVRGEIKPAWSGGVSKGVPTWEQVGASRVFVDVARVLEFERQLSQEHSRTSVLVLGRDSLGDAQSLALIESLKAQGAEVAVDLKKYIAKHGAQYEVSSVLLPQASRWEEQTQRHTDKASAS